LIESNRKPAGKLRQVLAVLDGCAVASKPRGTITGTVPKGSEQRREVDHALGALVA
jgi:hypothetical protein